MYGSRGKITRKISNYILLNYYENEAYQNLWDDSITVPRRKLIALHVYIKEEY